MNYPSTDSERNRLHKLFESMRATLPEAVWLTAIADHVYGRDLAMYRRSGGRNFQALCDLIGMTAEVELSEVEYYDGYRDHRAYWTERVTITVFRGLTREPVYNFEGYEVGYEAHPCFEVITDRGRTYVRYAEDLHDVRPAD